MATWTRRNGYTAPSRARLSNAEPWATPAVSAVSGGELAPPDWLVDEFIALARPGRVFADLAVRMPLPENVSSINIPKINTGTTAAVQTTQNTALSQTDITTTSVSATIVTIGGKQVVSQQLLDQSGTPIDRLVLSDLAADYARQLGSQYINGSGTGGNLRGVLNAAGAVQVAYTTGTPKVVDGVTPANSFLNAVVRAKVAVNTTRFMPASACLMHPRRWGWVQEALDANGRPLITPEDANGDQNQPGTDGANTAAGRVGTLANLPVFLDPNIPINTGAGTNQDPVIVCRLEDLLFYESPMQMETFRETYSDSLGVLFRCFAYSAAIPDRYGASVQIINGTGLVTPVL
ncbi:MAG: phage major capsid protein [Actinomycetota bacterium]|nr:phage major capsid protein [Actinomycetota bacterium]